MNIRFEKELKILEENSQLRNFPKFCDNLIDLSSNSYLCLEKVPEIHERAAKLCNGNFSGALASRLVMQNTPLFEQLEETIAKWKGNNKSILLFNSGFTANIGIIQALCNKNTTIFSDKLNHASIIDGIRLSGAKFFRFNHCDYEHLEELLQENKGEKFIVSDSVFSMDGDVADIKKLIEIAEKNEAYLFIDEAHSTGIFKSDYRSENLLIMGTLSKAIAGMGAYLQCSEVVKKYLINKCRPLIFSTALPRSVLAWDIAAVEYLSKNENLGKKLLEKAAVFRDKLSEIGVNFGKSQSQIVPIIVGSNENAINLSQKFLDNGIYIPAIRPPTIPVGSSRCRISLNLGTSGEILQKIISILKEN